jgi:tetratricopeptide (TPR) repeat protein
MNRYFWLFIAFLAYLPIEIKAAVPFQFEQGRIAFIQARDHIYNFDKDDRIISSYLERSQEVFSSLSNKKEKLYWTAQVEFLTGLSFMRKKDYTDAAIHFEECRKLVLNAIAEYGEFSEGYALMADTYLQLMWCKGISYQVLHFQQLKSLPEKALKLDSTNVRAFYPLALFWIKAPQSLGGDTQKAIDLLNKASKLSVNDKGNLFNTYYLLGTAYMRKHDNVNAIHYLQMALSIFPDNQWAKEDLESIEGKN